MFQRRALCLVFLRARADRVMTHCYTGSVEEAMIRSLEEWEVVQHGSFLMSIMVAEMSCSGVQLGGLQIEEWK